MSTPIEPIIGISTFLKWLFENIIPSVDGKPLISSRRSEQFWAPENSGSFKDLTQSTNEREEYAYEIHSVRPA
jgi:hypothetical protein